MFIVCEPISLGMEHVPFNTALLKTIRLAFPEADVEFYAEDAHSNFVREQIGEQVATTIGWHHIVPPARHSGFFSRLSFDFKTIQHLLEKMVDHSGEDVLVVTGNSSILWALKYYTARLHRNKKVQVVLHGNFSTLKRIPRREMLNPLYYVGCLKTALKLPGYQRLQHIVLEESVRNAVLECMPFLRKSLYVFDHPVPVDEGCDLDDKSKMSLNTPIQFGYLGRATEKKGFSKYLDVASEITKQFPGQANFHFIGRVSEKFRKKNISKMAFLSELPGESRLSRSDFVDRLKSLHYICLFYDHYYEYCASGVLMDSIAWEKPIIASRLMMFQDLEQKFGDIGYLCNNNEIAEAIGGIILAKDFERYNGQIMNIRKIKMIRIPEALSSKYSVLVKTLKHNFS